MSIGNHVRGRAFKTATTALVKNTCVTLNVSDPKMLPVTVLHLLALPSTTLAVPHLLAHTWDALVLQLKAQD